MQPAGILEWHGDACHICGQPMAFGKKRNAMLSATRDHLTPKSHGGTGDVANILLAHKICNMIRSDRPITEELRIMCAAAVVVYRRYGSFSVVRQRVLRAYREPDASAWPKAS